MLQPYKFKCRALERTGPLRHTSGKMYNPIIAISRRPQPLKNTQDAKSASSMHAQTSPPLLTSLAAKDSSFDPAPASSAIISHPQLPSSPLARVKRLPKLTPAPPNGAEPLLPSLDTLVEERARALSRAGSRKAYEGQKDRIREIRRTQVQNRMRATRAAAMEPVKDQTPRMERDYHMKVRFDRFLFRLDSS